MRGTSPLPGPLTEDDYLLLRMKQGYKAQPAVRNAAPTTPAPSVSFAAEAKSETPVASPMPEPEVANPQAAATTSASESPVPRTPIAA